jgi:hypothetical protein
MPGMVEAITVRQSSLTVGVWSVSTDRGVHALVQLFGV